MTSTASGKSSRNFVLAALLEKRQQPARQAEAAGKADAERRQQAAADHEARRRKRPAPSAAPMMIRNCCFDQVSPACAICIGSGRLFGFLRA